jgi:AraC family transcriptional regulator, transcriptional activator of pobA
MKPIATECRRLNTVTDYTRLCGLPAPVHPLLTLIDLEQTRDRSRSALHTPVVQQLYSIWLRKNFRGRLHYGHQSYDFSEGVLGFVAPGQVFAIDETIDISGLSGWMLVFHPDLLGRYPLAQKIRSYGFFSYVVHEALHVSAAEEAVLDTLLGTIRGEYGRPIDRFSQDVLVAQLELLLSYANRSYHRQFVTRQATSHDLLSRFETRLIGYFAQDADLSLPTVQYFADELNVSAAYLSDMLPTLTGQTTQQHIHHVLIEKAKQ